ncbi:MAG: GldG family protein [Candidatus Thiodiazotropha sp.]
MKQTLVKRLNNLLFYLLLGIIWLLLAWLGSRYDQQWDWTRQGSNSLSATSVEILARTPGPLTLTAYVPETRSLRERIERFIARYQYHKPDIHLNFVDPLRNPDESRRLGISLSGEILLSYDQREERIQQLDEEHLSNAILRLGQRHERWIVGLTGHGERDLLGKANHDLGRFGEQLEQQGFRIISLDLATLPELPERTALLLIASPQRPLLSGERERLKAYLAKGGNLCLLSDPDNPVAAGLAHDLAGVDQLPGTLVDANVRELGIDNPSIALVPRYPDHDATRGFNLLTLYPQAAALRAPESGDWQVTPLLRTLDRSWNETGPLSGEIERNPEAGELPGPLSIGLALTRDRGGSEQRLMVIGDGDFLSNSFLDNAGNQDLGLTLSRWLAGDDEEIGIPAPEADDRTLQLSRTTILIISLGPLIVLPTLLLLVGGWIAWRRNRA